MVQESTQSEFVCYFYNRNGKLYAFYENRVTDFSNEAFSNATKIHIILFQIIYHHLKYLFANVAMFRDHHNSPGTLQNSSEIPGCYRM